MPKDPVLEIFFFSRIRFPHKFETEIDNEIVSFQGSHRMLTTLVSSRVGKPVLKGTKTTVRKCTRNRNGCLLCKSEYHKAATTGAAYQYGSKMSLIRSTN